MNRCRGVSNRSSGVAARWQGLRERAIPMPAALSIAFPRTERCSGHRHPLQTLPFEACKSCWFLKFFHAPRSIPTDRAFPESSDSQSILNIISGWHVTCRYLGRSPSPALPAPACLSSDPSFPPPCRFRHFFPSASLLVRRRTGVMTCFPASSRLAARPYRSPRFFISRCRSSAFVCSSGGDAESPLLRLLSGP